MKQINLRLPDDTHAKLTAMAAADRRSVNNMMVALIDQAPAPVAPATPETVKDPA